MNEAILSFFGALIGAFAGPLVLQRGEKKRRLQIAYLDFISAVFQLKATMMSNYQRLLTDSNVAPGPGRFVGVDLKDLTLFEFKHAALLLEEGDRASQQKIEATWLTLGVALQETRRVLEVDSPGFDSRLIDFMNAKTALDKALETLVEAARERVKGPLQELHE